MLLLEIPTLTWSEELWRVAVAAGLGGAVGLERELREREAGFRTHEAPSERPPLAKAHSSPRLKLPLGRHSRIIRCMYAVM